MSWPSIKGKALPGMVSVAVRPSKEGLTPYCGVLMWEPVVLQGPPGEPTADVKTTLVSLLNPSPNKIKGTSCPIKASMMPSSVEEVHQSPIGTSKNMY